MSRTVDTESGDIGLRSAQIREAQRASSASGIGPLLMPFTETATLSFGRFAGGLLSGLV